MYGSGTKSYTTFNGDQSLSAHAYEHQWRGMITLLAIADRPPRQSIQKILSENTIDLICTLGDLTLEDLRELEDVTTIPKIGVYGNHCSGKYFEALGIKNMHLTTFEHRGVIFGGFEGSLRYKQSSAKMYTQDEATALLQDFPRVDVMLAHSPPAGINDEPGDMVHGGFTALRSYLESKKPQYFLHGHTYPTEEQLVHTFIETEILYIYADRILTLSV